MSSASAIFAPLPVFEAHLERTLASLMQPGRLRNAMAYSSLGAGKRLRPMLAWHCCEAMSDGRLTGEASLPAGAAIELVHCFSLVHDDLPALDNDDLRRGKPTLHKHAGEAMAILAGDCLLTLAFEVLSQQDLVLAEHVLRHGRKMDTLHGVLRANGGAEGALRVQMALLRELARATTLMIQGQVWDTLGGLPAHADTSDAARLHAVHAGKTGALISAACRMGAMTGLSAADEASLNPISAYAMALGVLFQAVDDLLDVTQTSEHTGKRTGKDAAAGKLTFPVVYGVAGTQREIADLRAQACDAVAGLGARGQTLRDIAAYVATRTK